MMQLYHYYRSSTSFRVRIALNLKNIAYELKSVHLLNNGGEHLTPAYKALHPQGLVPCLAVCEPGQPPYFLTQSLAIIEYLEERFPAPSLLPTDPWARAKVRAFAQAIACEMHPLNNLRVLQYLKKNLALSEANKQSWYHHWLAEGFGALEQSLPGTGPYCFGETPTVADLCLIPQVWNALRFDFSLADYPLIQKIYAHCLKHPAFDRALPENQPEGG